MVDNPANSPLSERNALAPDQLLIMQSLVPIASAMAIAQLESMSTRLAEALFKVSEQTAFPNEANLSFNAFNHLKKNSAQLFGLIADQLNELLLEEIHSTGKAGQSIREREDLDLSLVTFDEMENTVAIGNIVQAIEREHADALAALNIRLGHLLQREEMSVAQNPFRPEVFLQAVYQAWCKFDAEQESHQLMLRLLQPDVFLQFQPIFHELNEALIARGIIPSLAEAYRIRKSRNRTPASTEAPQEASLHSKLQNLLMNPQDGGGAAAGGPGGGYFPGGAPFHPGGGAPFPPGAEAGLQSTAGVPHLNLPPMFGAGAADQQAAGSNFVTITVNAELLSHLTSVQNQLRTQVVSSGPIAAPQSADALRQVKTQAAHGMLSSIDENTIELLAKIFDFVFGETHIPSDIKGLISQLQIPLLKTVLTDKDFFFNEEHPARRLLETLAKTSVAWNQEKGREDPLFQALERGVEEVHEKFEKHDDPFSKVVADLESFLEKDEQASEMQLADSIAEVTRQEKVRQAQELAERDVAARVRTGEVAGFVEIFLETQWVRILTMAHNVKDSKPEVLEKALKTMDDLIWSVKPKGSPEERKELVNRLPPMLAQLNTWLNAMKWNTPERALFFSSLAERHASIVRDPIELSTRRQVEIAVTAAQKASERVLASRAKEMGERGADEFVQLVNSFERGAWVEFQHEDGTAAKFKLTWISPKRSRFIFSNRLGNPPFSFTSEQLVQTFRDGKATLILMRSVVDRALAAALSEKSEGKTASAAG